MKGKNFNHSPQKESLLLRVGKSLPKEGKKSGRKGGWEISLEDVEIDLFRGNGGENLSGKEKKEGPCKEV